MSENERPIAADCARAREAIHERLDGETPASWSTAEEHLTALERHQGLHRCLQELKPLHREAESRSEWFIAGSSLLFEGMVLGLACMLFVRRDY